MGCTQSRQEEAQEVRACSDRRRYIKEAITQRKRLGSAHAAYLKSLHRLSLALCSYVSEGDRLNVLQESRACPSTSSAVLIRSKNTSSSLVVSRLTVGGSTESEEDAKDDTEYNSQGENGKLPKGVEESGLAGLETKIDNNDHHLTTGTEIEEEVPNQSTVSVSRQPANMAEVMKDIEGQFLKIVQSAREVSELLEVTPLRNNGRSMGTHMTRTRSRNSSGYAAAQEPLDESSQQFSSLRVTLDRLYDWEKRLHEEVKSGENVRVAYERRCNQPRNQEITGAEPSDAERTTAARRIETLRNETLQPQLVQLIKGLAKLWQVMANTHLTQQRTISEAGPILASEMPSPSPGAGATLAEELRGWIANFTTRLEAQRALAVALAGWASSCSGGDSSRPISAICAAWASAVKEDVCGDVEAATKGVERFAAAIVAVEVKKKRGECEDERSPVLSGAECSFAAVAGVAGAVAASYEKLTAA